MDDITRRLTELEIKASFQEDLLDSLNQVIVRQQAQIDRLISHLADLQRRLPDEQAGRARSLLDELPPHY